MQFKAGDIVNTTFIDGEFRVILARKAGSDRKTVTEESWEAAYMIALPDTFKTPIPGHRILRIEEYFFYENLDWLDWVSDSPGSEKYFLVGQRFMWAEPEELMCLDVIRYAEHKIINEIWT